MLKKTNRLAKDRDISAAFARGRSFFNPFFTIRFLPATKAVRFTVVVSTKVSKKAVARNRLKRIIREYIRKNLQRFKNGDYVVILKPKAAAIAEDQVLKSFIDACAKVR
jgi:ribonuclease P protein component